MKKKILILCTGNSCRSIMAEALVNQLGKDRYEAFSAGSDPVGVVHPGAIATLRRHGIDPGDPRSKSWNEFTERELDLVITVCDQAAGESCPIFPGSPTRIHWSTPDPAQAQGSEAEIEAAFDSAFTLLRQRIEDELL